MIATFDCETRGLFGGIFRLGYFDDVNGYKNFYTAKEFITYIYDIAKKLPDIEYKDKKGKVKTKKDILNIYAFNLEFDLSKILKSKESEQFDFDINFTKSLIINGRFNTCVLEKINITFRDIFPLVGTSLENAGKDFKLQTFKKDLRTQNKDLYFKTVHPDDPELLEYLEADVISTFELVKTVLNLSGLTDEQFINCPTLASLAMKIFKEKYPDDFLKVKNSELLLYDEEWVRLGYYGGRTEVFKPELIGGYHFDVNSLYPYVMEENFYPVGGASISKDNLDHKTLNKMKMILDEKNHYYMIECTVKIPNQNIPPLAYRHEGKLIFPIGIITGVWTSVEIDYAINYCQCEILEIKKLVWWTQKSKVFERFVSDQKHIKINSTGAMRTFAKLIQNSLYGKLAMQRSRITYENWTEEKAQKFTEKGLLFAKVLTNIKPIIKFEKMFFADYIRPQFAVFVTAFARLELLKMMKHQENRFNNIYYCDTDSIITKNRIEPEFEHNSDYGKWKLEREILRGLFLLPKLYAEIDNTTKEEILKSKGIIKEFAKTMTFKDYEKYYTEMKLKQDVKLYGYSDTKYHDRINIIRAMAAGMDLDSKLLLRKQFKFSGSNIFKRNFDFENNTSTPLIIKYD